MRAQRSAAVRIFTATACVAGSPCSSSSTARATTTDSGLLSSCATPASSEPSAASFSRWYSASRWRASSSRRALLLGDVGARCRTPRRPRRRVVQRELDRDVGVQAVVERRGLLELDRRVALPAPAGRWRAASRAVASGRISASVLPSTSACGRWNRCSHCRLTNRMRPSVSLHRDHGGAVVQDLLQPRFAVLQRCCTRARSAMSWRSRVCVSATSPRHGVEGAAEAAEFVVAAQTAARGRGRRRRVARRRAPGARCGASAGSGTPATSPAPARSPSPAQ